MIEKEVLIPAGFLKRIHVDQARIRANHKDGTNLPPVTIQAKNGPYKAHEVHIKGPSRVVYREESPLSCGARMWIETRAAVQTTVFPAAPVVVEDVA